MTTGRTRVRLGAAIACAALVGATVLGRATRDALLLGAHGAIALPRASLAAAFAGIAVMLLATRASVRFGPARALSMALVVNVLGLAGEMLLAETAPRACAVVVYLHTGTLSGPLVAMLWTLVSESFDPRAAKRAFGWIGAAGSLGGAVGGALGWGLGRTGSALACLTALVVLSGVALVGVALVGPPRPGAGRAETPTLSLSLETLANTGYLRRLGALMLFLGMAEAMLDCILGARVELDTASPLRAFGLFHLGVAAASAVVLAILGRPALARLGLTGTICVMPLAVALVASLGALAPGLAAAVVGRGMHGVLRSSLFRSAYEIFFTPLEAGTKRGVKLLVDVGCDRLGTGLGSAVVVVAMTLAPASAERIAYGAVILAALGAFAVTQSLRDGYVHELEASLRRNLLDAATMPIVDKTTRHAVTATQLKIDREQLLHEIDLLVKHDDVAEKSSKTRESALALELAVGALKTPDGMIHGTAIEYLDQFLPLPLQRRVRTLFPERTRTVTNGSRSGALAKTPRPAPAPPCPAASTSPHSLLHFDS